MRTSDNEYDRGDAEHHKSVLRSKGIAKAVDRLTKEDTVVEHGDPWERDEHGKSVGWRAKEADRDIKAIRADAKKYPHGNPNIKIMKKTDVDKHAHKILSKIFNKEDVGDPKAAVNADGLPNAQLEPVSEKKKQKIGRAHV